MLALLVLLLVSTTIASPTPRLPALKFSPPIHAFDQDRHINSTIHYELVAGNERHLFSVDQNNGTLFLERELDLDTLPGNTFTLQKVKDKFNDDLMAVAFVRAIDIKQRRKRPDKVRMFCGLKTTLKTGLVDMVTALKPCIQDKVRENLKRLPEIADSFFKYVCFNEGQNFTSLINNVNNFQCLEEHKKKILDCALKGFRDKIKDLETDLSKDTDNYYEAFDEEIEEQKKRHDCQLLSDLKICLKNELDQCPTQSSSKFVTGLLDSILIPMCQQY